VIVVAGQFAESDSSLPCGKTCASAVEVSRQYEWLSKIR